FRNGVCTNPTCTVPTGCCDLDHVIPFPEGPTTGINLNADCRPEHRAKTHGGHETARTGPHDTTWKTPTGHTYRAHDEPLPVEGSPDEPDRGGP
ncbi:MAG TPA: HNH endonuclease signature motif containing protein, partial [Nakamurella sp.]